VNIFRLFISYSILNRKPQYPMAVDYPLVLFDVEFGENIKWVQSEENLHHSIADLQGYWAQHALKYV